MSFFGNAEVLRQGIDQKHNDEEIERVQRPSEKSGKNGRACSRLYRYFCRFDFYGFGHRQVEISERSEPGQPFLALPLQ
jgi:hypothetical protein